MPVTPCGLTLHTKCEALDVLKLPSVLEREPIIEAVFEIRFGGALQLAEILPGMLFSKLDQKPKVNRQPAADIPQPLRASDQNLTFAPIIQLELDQFTISIGDRNVVVGCKLPYPKWPAFKAEILKLTNIMTELGVEGSVERFSVKYVNLIPAASYAEQIAKIEMLIRIGSLQVVDNHFNLQVHNREGDVLHILTVVTGASANLVSGETRHGVVVDVDSIRIIEPVAYQQFAEGLEPELETLRQSNKIKFFSCLKSQAIEEMGPIYDA